MEIITQETRLKKAHVRLMKHEETALYSGVMLMGKSVVVDKECTAYTNGFDKFYGRKFLESLDNQEVNALVLHENLHVALKHMQRFTKEFKENPMLVNASADFVVNDIIVNLKDKSLCRLPKGGLYDKKYHNWSVREVYNDLKDEQGQQGQQGQQGSDGNPTSDGTANGIPQNAFDEHVWEDTKELSQEQLNRMSKSIDKALREGSVLAGRVGAKIPRQISDIVAPKIDWKQLLREFISNAVNGKDEYSWRRYNKRLMSNDIYMPTTVNESVGELVVAMDTSGSIGQREITAFVSELVSICETVQPDKVRVLWWDTKVASEQIFTNYTNMLSELKAEGGGGTDPDCISDYISANRIKCDACIVFTDGYFGKPKWNSDINTMWLVTQCENVEVPSGVVVKQEL